MDWGYWDLYDQYVTSKQFKYNDNTQVNKYMFKGKRIVPIVGIPESTIVLGNFSTGMDSNLWMGVDYANDTEVLKIDRLQANSELYFFQMKMKMDVNNRSSSRDCRLDSLQINLKNNPIIIKKGRGQASLLFYTHKYGKNQERNRVTH